MSGRLRVVSWNIEHAERIDEAIDLLRSAPGLAGADVILLQEMDDTGPRRIADALGLHAAYLAGSRHSVTDRPFGNAILSRWPLGRPEEVELPHQARIAGERRIAVGAVAEVEEERVHLWSAHFEVSTLPFRRQIEQYQRLADRLARTTGLAIVGTDANTASMRSVRALTDALSESGFARSPTGPTFRRFRRTWTLDHVFVRRATIVDSGVTTGHDASDHDPVWSVIET